MTRKTVLLDCDGVLCDFIGGVCRTLAALGHGGHLPEHVTEFDFYKALKLEPDVARLVKWAIGNDPGWWTTLRPFPDAIVGVAALRAVADVYIVTSPWNSCSTWLADREDWLKRHFDIPNSHVIACSAKHLVRGDVFVDDKTETLRTWAGPHNQTGDVGGAFAVQWETPHNRFDVWCGRSTRSWSQLVEWAR